MSAAEALKAARAAGISVHIDGDDLLLEASAPPPPAVLDLLSRHKAGIVALLRPANNGPPEPDEVDLEERKAIALGAVPELYRDAWAWLQVQKPATVTETQWRQAIEAAARFLGQWGKLAADFGWMPGDIFDIPTSDGCSGLIWWIVGRTVTALGPEHAAAGEPAFDRITRKDWANGYAQGASR